MTTAIEKTGKTVEDALAAALEELGITRDLVEYEVLEEPVKGFLGLIGNKPAKIKAMVKRVSPLDLAYNFLKDLFAAMHIEVKIEQNTIEEGCIFNLCGENLGILIGKHGQNLDALQYLTNLAANRGLRENKLRVIIDVENYRKRREDTLCRLAARLADKVRRTGEKIILEPMARHERKIIHTALQDDRRVITYSDGEEPYRKVVIATKR